MEQRVQSKKNSAAQGTKTETVYLERAPISARKYGASRSVRGALLRHPGERCSTPGRTGRTQDLTQPGAVLEWTNMSQWIVMSQKSAVPLTLLAVVLAMTSLSAGAARAQTPSPLPLPNPYHIDETFQPEMPAGLRSLGAVSGLKVGPDNNLYVFHRCVENSCTGHDDVPPMLVYTPHGKLLRSMGAGMFV